MAWGLQGAALQQRASASQTRLSPECQIHGVGASGHPAGTHPTLCQGTAGQWGPSAPSMLSSLFPSLVQVYHLLFGSSPLAPDNVHEQDLWDQFGPSDKISQLEVRNVQGMRWGTARPPHPLCTGLPSSALHAGWFRVICPVRGDVMGHFRMFRATVRSPGSHCGAATDSPSALRWASAHNSVCHGNGWWHCLEERRKTLPPVAWDALGCED